MLKKKNQPRSKSYYDKKVLETKSQLKKIEDEIGYCNYRGFKQEKKSLLKKQNRLKKKLNCFIDNSNYRKNLRERKR